MKRSFEAVGVFALIGNGNEAFTRFAQICQGVEIRKVTFLSLVLVCCH